MSIVLEASAPSAVPTREQTRALYPQAEGFVERDGVRVFYEVYGEGEPTILLLPTWSIIHSRFWKLQIPYLARHFRVVTFDGRGNGRSDRPLEPAAYAESEFAADALAVMDATGTNEAALVSLSLGSQRGLILAANHPDRVTAAIFIGPSLPIEPGFEGRTVAVEGFDKELPTDEGWAKFNRHYWLKDYRGFLEFFFSQCFTEPHSTKQIEDCVGWGMETTPEVLITTEAAEGFQDRDGVLEACSRVHCPVLVIHGVEDAISPHERGRQLAEATGGSFVSLRGAGHIPLARDPVKVNLLLRNFLTPTPAEERSRTWTRAKSRRKRALFVSSPIGLGHARRDVAIAKELKQLVPELEIDWLAQNPVTRVLEAEGERIHPASRLLANESGHIESESAEHDLHCFQAWRRMDEILLANFMVFHDLVDEDNYDLWIGDEAWELDYYLHENPEQKRAAYVWLTDFVGWLPMPDGGEREAFLTADYNAEMIEHIARFPRVRDRAIFVGAPDDVVPDSFGPDLPLIRDWTEENYDFSGGYITGFDPNDLADREWLRAEEGFGPDEKVCIVTVGGSGVGGHLLRKVIESFPEAKRLVPELRMVVVTGPRIDPESLPKAEGFDVRSYVHDLYRQLAACDLAGELSLDDRYEQMYALGGTQRRGRGTMPPVNRNNPIRAESSESKYALMEFLREFPDDATCLDYLWRTLYSEDGKHHVCPVCEVERTFHRVESRPLYSCAKCGKAIHPTAGTIFEKSSTSLHLWFYGVYLMSSTRCGVSAKQLERELGVTYKTAWRMFNKIRSLLGQDASMFGGTVEYDEAFIGGKAKWRSPARSRARGVAVGRVYQTHTPIVGMAQRGDKNNHGKIRAEVAKGTPKNSDFAGHVEVKVLPGSTIYTDDAMFHKHHELDQLGYQHKRVNHTQKIYVSGDVHTNTIEGFWALLKQGMGGVYHSVSTKHLQSYIDEYTFRYNNRDQQGRGMFEAFMERVASEAQPRRTASETPSEAPS